MKRPFEIPAGYGFSKIENSSWNTANLDSCMDRLMIWEAPRRFKDGTPRKEEVQYIVSADIASGMGLDRTVADVWRLGTVREPDEQVAQFVTNSVEAVAFAAYLDAIGRFYADNDELDALMAIECNQQGYSTQTELQGHYGYSNFHIWEYHGIREPARRFSRSIGWWTTPRTRPMIIGRLVKALRSYVIPDPENPATVVKSPDPDAIINSPFTIEELQDFQVGANGRLDQAEASGDSHDDCLMTAAIALHIANERHFLEREPLSEQRRNRMEADEKQALLAERLGQRCDFQNCDMTVAEMNNEYEPDSDIDWEQTI